MLKNILGATSLLLAATAAAQIPQDMAHGSQVWSEAVKLIQDHDTVGAIDALATVNRNDSIYERVLSARLDLLIELKRYAEADEVALMGRALNAERSGRFAIKHVALLFDMEKYPACIAAADSLIAQRPGLLRPRHLRALALAKNGDKQGSLRQLMSNAREFPYNRDAHLLLTSIAAEEGYVALSAMAGAMAQVVRYDDEMASALLTYQDGLLNGTVEKKPSGYDLSITGDDVTELDQLIGSRMAMDKKYKVEPDLTYPFCRQSHLLFTQVAQGSAKGFYHEFYGPLIKEIMEKDLFEGYVYHCLSSSEYPKVRSVAERNRSKITDFRKAMAAFLQSNYGIRADGADQVRKFHGYNDDGDLSSIGGTNDAATLRTGEWTFYQDNGLLSSQGRYDDEGEEVGLWRTWYDNGMPRSKGEYTNGELDGYVVNYYGNGQVMDSATVRAGKKEGLYTGHRYMGGQAWQKQMTNDMSNGEVLEFHPDGTRKWTYAHLQGKINGPVKQTGPDGAVLTEGTYESDKRVGVYTNHYAGAGRSDEYNFAAGLAQGPYKEWHRNGAVSYEGELVQDKNVGERRKYDEWGMLERVDHFDTQGRMDGIRKEFTPDGALLMESEYSRDLLVRYTYYDRQGAVKSTAKRSQGKFDFHGFYIDGKERVKGTYLDEGAKTGTWRYVYPDGTTDAVENYKDGKEEGDQLRYDGAGALSSKETAYGHDGHEYSQYTRYYPSGAVMEAGQRKGDQFEGIYTRQGPDGVRWALEYYVDGERDGWQEYFDMDGDRWYSERLQGGAITERINYDTAGVAFEHIRFLPGQFTLLNHYPNGKVASSESFLNGTRHGVFKWFYPDGTLEIEGSYRCGSRDGAWKYYHINGKKRMEQTYAHGRLNGTSTEYYPDGTLESKYDYSNGELHGQVVDHAATGKLSSSATYANGVRHGRVTNHTIDGTPTMARFYHKGELVAYGMPAADGTVTDTVKVESGLVTLRTDYAPGKPARTLTYRNGILHGEFKEYDPAGQLIRDVVYKSDERDGISKEYHANGKPQRTMEHVDGLQHGEELVYRANGTLKERITYSYGVKHGPWVLYNEQGKPEVTVIMRNNDAVHIQR
ncbi:MAG: hypothetical protein JNM62_05155 [Flavobacteriales bacterium]|nr:hypothetical protein [Flavobacteriales bacterium]